MRDELSFVKYQKYMKLMDPIGTGFKMPFKQDVPLSVSLIENIVDGVFSTAAA